MNRLLEAANRYIQTSDWKIIAVLKFCLISLGMIVGLFVRKEHRGRVLAGAVFVFFATYIPLMVKFCRVFTGKE